VKRFLEGHPDYPGDLPNGEIRNQRIAEILTRPIYAGYVEAQKWDVSLRKGHHEGLIDLATFEKNQERLRSGGYAPARKTSTRTLRCAALYHAMIVPSL
jgi:hypothetical protein